MIAYEGQLKLLMKKPWFPYVLPFGLFLILTGPVRYFAIWSPFLYIVKTVIVGSRPFAQALLPRMDDGALLRPPGAGHLDSA